MSMEEKFTSAVWVVLEFQDTFSNVPTVTGPHKPTTTAPTRKQQVQKPDATGTASNLGRPNASGLHLVTGSQQKEAS